MKHVALRTVALLTGLTLAAPGVAEADPTDQNIADSVHAIRPADSVKPLKTTEDDGKRVTVRISADLLFAFDKADLTAAARQTLAQLTPQLKSSVGTIEVDGHSDSIGDPGYNRSLSKKRADAVKTALEQQLGGGIGDRIQARGFGETKPVAPNQSGGKDDPEGRAQNRRVEIVFTKP
ncbi:hypothetical protein GCM10023191_040500 [Actinoallomurus oryzae]|uniref:OmpA-like domain-containing protein n=1 Tax=Actinoallomurus oryzae TaxID=502180 RepID=A0ABP8Q6T7_9ACTN